MTKVVGYHIHEEGDEVQGTVKCVATYIFTPSLQNWRGAAGLYHMDPPYLGYEHVVISSVKNKWADETYIFPSDKDGLVTDFVALQGSTRPSTSHNEILTSIGYIP